MTFSNSDDRVRCSGCSRLYQICASRMKLNRERWTIVALPLKRIRAEEDRRAEDPLKRGNQPAILLSAGVHAEALQHLGRGSESDRLALLLDGQGGQEDRNEAVLPKRHAEVRMAGDLKDELPFRRSYSSWSFGRRRTGRPQRTNGRELKHRSCVRCSRLMRTSSMPSPAPASVWRRGDRRARIASISAADAMPDERRRSAGWRK